ncbi:predicted protein [Histoplasma capsulatum G186AR]|uniref:Uncharacterized protein n=1 Tax=Ajellomyces capsulatus (strain G186AR / H82 / ATCC MYA-2454 / RMSCC 2432) TaxID=447093 RepID=C0P095_AJECG|nr:uncharacterized protein HCBG_08814 [Histoplasma capsulatum G186AR]EEH02911.1 predicted protein [Histoplasma capsulatum G186AR]
MAYGLWLDGIDHVELGSEPLSASKHSHSAPLCVVEEDRSHDTYSVQFTLLSHSTIASSRTSDSRRQKKPAVEKEKRNHNPFPPPPPTAVPAAIQSCHPPSPSPSPPAKNPEPSGGGQWIGL